MSESTGASLGVAVGHGLSPGALLRDGRRARGLEIPAVVAALRVETRMVEAMEADQFDVFHAPVYARGFLRTYANFLSISASQVLAAYDALVVAPVVPTLIPQATARMPSRDLRKFRKPVLLVFGALLALVVVIWLYSKLTRHFAGTSSVDSALAPVPQERVSVPNKPVATAGAPRAPRSVTQSMATQALPAQRVIAPRIPVPVPAPVLAPGPVTKVAPTQSAKAVLADPLVVSATRGESWVEVYSKNGTRVLYEMLHVGEMRAVPGPGPWRVFLGEANALHLTVGERTVVVPSSRRAAATARFVINGDGAAN